MIAERRRNLRNRSTQTFWVLLGDEHGQLENVGRLDELAYICPEFGEIGNHFSKRLLDVDNQKHRILRV